MRRTTTFAALAVLLLGTMTACGNDDSDDGGTDSAPDEAALTLETDAEGNVASDGDDIPPIGEGSGDDAGGGTGGSGAAGTITVDGVEFGFDEVLRCEEDSSDLDNIERLLEVIYTGGDFRLDLYTSEMDNVGVTQTINWVGPDGRFNGGAVETAGGWIDSVAGTTGGDEPPYEVDGNRITGSATLSADRGSDTLVEISFDVVFPDETTRCR